MCEYIALHGVIYRVVKPGEEKPDDDAIVTADEGMIIYVRKIRPVTLGDCLLMAGALPSEIE